MISEKEFPNLDNSEKKHDEVEEGRTDFEKKAEELATEFSVDKDDVMIIFAEIQNRLLDKKSFGSSDEKSEFVSQSLSRLDEEKEFYIWQYVRSELEKEKSQEIASTDSLTRLLNRRALDIELSRWAEIYSRNSSEKSTEEPKPFAMIMIDIDHFKSVNDSFGHPAGDRVIEAVARVIRESVRPNDMSARYGGEEMAVIVDGDINVAKSIAERIRQDIENIDLSELGIDTEKREKITASLGVAEYEHNEEDIEKALGDMKKRADDALYVSKDSGRNQVQVSDK